MNTKTQARQRRAKKSRVHMRTAGSVRLSVHRTPRHIYAQIISGDSKTVLAQASTLDKDLRSGATGNVAAAAAVGKLVAERANRPRLDELPRAPQLGLGEATEVRHERRATAVPRRRGPRRV